MDTEHCVERCKTTTCYVGSWEHLQGDPCPEKLASILKPDLLFTHKQFIQAQLTISSSLILVHYTCLLIHT